MMTRSIPSRTRDESGAIAVMVGVMALLLVSVAALAVDLGHAYVQKQAIQKRADFAALAGAVEDNLPMTAAGAMCEYGRAALAGDQAIIDTAAYLSETPGGTTVLAGDLVDCDLADGEAGYGTFRSDSACVGGVCLAANQNQLSVISQPRTVEFGLARVMGFDNVDVRGQATVEIKTPLQKTLPLYAFTGCDYGSNTISQPTNGQSSTGVTLAAGSDKNTYISEDTLAVTPASTTSPPTVQLNSTTTTITIAGNRLDKVIEVGFFRSSATPPAPVRLAKQSVAVPDGFTVAADAKSLTFTVPSSVTDVQDIWFIRLYGPNGGQATAPNEWTPVEKTGNADKSSNLAALPVSVGNATLSCSQGSTSGNFGTLDLFNSSSGAPAGQDDNIAYNIAYGLQYGLATYPKAYWTPLLYECVEGQDGVAKTWPQEGTNCVGTKPGLPSNAARQGLVTGIGSGNGALLKDPTSDELCPFDHPTGTTHVDVAPTGQTISDDVLTCYFLNDTVTVADVSSSLYSGGVVIDQAIYQSARFVSVPVLGARPAQGSSTKYEIVEFRPGFITGQSPSATRANPFPVAPTTDNGLVWSGSNQLMSVNVIFLNTKALANPPLDPDGGYIPYTGSGPKLPLLVN